MATKVENDAVVDQAVAGATVAAAAHRELGPRLPHDPNDPGYLRRVRRAHDPRRSAVDPAGKHRASGVVAPVLRGDQAVAEGGSQLLDGGKRGSGSHACMVPEGRRRFDAACPHADVRLSVSPKTRSR